jgi:hypothetical protein
MGILEVCVLQREVNANPTYRSAVTYAWAQVDNKIIMAAKNQKGRIL